MNCAPIALVCLVFAGVLHAEIIDRIAVVVGNGVITESEVNREVRLTDFLNAEKLDLSAQSRREAVQRLIEQRLVRRELELTRYPTPPEQDAEKMLEKIRDTRFKSRTEFASALDAYGITEADLKAHLYWQLTAMRFIELRFRPGIQVSEEDVQQELARRTDGKGDSATQPAALDDLRARIREELTERRVDRQVDAWLKSARERTRIEIREEALR